MRFRILLMIIVIFGSSLVYSLDDFTISYETIQHRIYPNETANYDLIIRNNLNYDSRFQIYSGAIEWDVTTEPSSDRNKLIPKYSSARIRLLIKPTKDFFSNLYGVPVRIKNLDTEEVKTPELILEIRGNVTQVGGEYRPAVRVNMDVEKDVDPRKGVTVTVSLKNQNRLNVTDLRIILSSDLFKKEYETSLEGLENKNLIYVIPLDPLLVPQNDRIKVNVIATQNNTNYEFMAAPVDYSIIAYGDVSKKVDEEKGFLKKKSSIVLTNTGNVKRDYKYKVRKTYISPLFFSANPKPVTEEIEGMIYYVWNGQLEPQETHNFLISVSYRWLFFLILFIIASVLVYYFTRSPISILKTAVVTQKSEGGASSLTVQIHIKNRVARKFHAIEVRDKVPNLLIVKSEFEIGTIQPSSILKHSKRGTIIKWNIEELDPFEERIISYKTAAKLSIIGEFSLPKTVLKYKKDIADDYKYVHSDVFKMDYS